LSEDTEKLLDNLNKLCINSDSAAWFQCIDAVVRTKMDNRCTSE